MAVYRNVSLNFWTDSKVDDEFSPEDKYFMLYLLTNPHTTLSGCYEISMKQMERETGYNVDSVRRILKRLEFTHNVIRYSANTKEVLVLNWYKYNWGTSEKVKSGVKESAKDIKNKDFRQYVIARCNNEEVEPIDDTTEDDVSEAFSEEFDEECIDVHEEESRAKNETESSVIDLILNDNSYKKVTQTEYNRWCELYPAVDVMQQLRNMAGWLESNQKKRKTKNGIDRFINSWLAREQDKGSKTSRSGIAMPLPAYLSDAKQRIEYNKQADADLVKKVKEMQEKMGRGMPA